MLTIHGIPNRSTHMPNSSPHICFSSGNETVPPSESLSQYPRSSASSSPLRLTAMLVPGVGSAWGGGSDAINVNPRSVSSWACMILSAIEGSSAPESPNVFSVSVPPKTSRQNSMASRAFPANVTYGLRRETIDPASSTNGYAACESTSTARSQASDGIGAACGRCTTLPSPPDRRTLLRHGHEHEVREVGRPPHRLPDTGRRLRGPGAARSVVQQRRDGAGCATATGFDDRLAAFGSLILFDKRGVGLSDPVPMTALPPIEEWMDDLRAVMDAVGSERAAIVAGRWRADQW